MKAGDLLKDNGDGDLGLVISTKPTRMVVLGKDTGCIAMVKWHSRPEPTMLDCSVLDSGWVEIISEA